MSTPTGADLYTFTSNLLGGYMMDETLYYQMLNIARSNRELKRAWRVLVKKDTSISVNTASLYTTPLTLPTDFRRWLRNEEPSKGSIQLFDGVNDVNDLDEVPYEDILDYKDSSGMFCTDLASNVFYILGTVAKQYTAYLWYIANFGDITKTTSWLKFPAEYHYMLAFDVAAMYRLGIDYDDINARNANDNARQAELIYSSMVKWDAKLAIGSFNKLNYPSSNGKGFRTGHINTDRDW